MALFTDTDHTRPAGPFSRLGAALTALGGTLMAAAEARSRVDRVRSLSAKSDADLAAMGLSRDRIVHHVYRDVFYV